MTCQKGANLLHYYVSKQDFSWSTKNSFIWCIITWKSRFSHDTPKRYKLVALLRGKAGFLMTRQELLYLMHYNVEKQFFSWHAKKVQIGCIITWKSRFSHDASKRCSFDALLRGKAVFLMTRQKSLIFDALIRGKAGFLMTRPKTMCTFDALLRFVAGFLMTRQKTYIWYIITKKSSFSHNAPKTLIFDALIRRKAGFLARQNTLIFDALLRVKACFLMTRQKGANLLHYYVSKHVFSWRAKNSYI